MSTIALAYITVPSKAKAQELVQDLLEQRLIACANIIPMESMYRWKGTIERQAEHLIIAKTLPELAHDLKKAVQMLHAYEVPCILNLVAEANESYYSFVFQALKS